MVHFFFWNRNKAKESRKHLPLRFVFQTAINHRKRKEKIVSKAKHQRSSDGIGTNVEEEKAAQDSQNLKKTQVVVRPRPQISGVANLDVVDAAILFLAQERNGRRNRF